jgi:MerR-like DNA binding protein
MNEDRFDELFGDLDADRYYPGSKKKIPDTPPAPTRRQAEPGEWDEHPIRRKVRGQEVEFFTIGMVAKALGRSAATLRDWEAHGVIPKARYRTNSKDPTKARRLYTRAQVEALIRTAYEEGLMKGDRRPIPASFTEKVTATFKGLEK